MSHAEHQQQLDQALLEFHSLWHPQPFRQIQPLWCEQWPDLNDGLLNLADHEVEHLNHDGEAALAWLAHYSPAVAGLASLSTLPASRASSLAHRDARWAWEIPGRKQQQIEAFASATQNGGKSVIDWCGGKGHLGRLLALQWGVPVHTLEIDPLLCADGEALARRQGLAHEFVNLDALTAANWPKVGQHAVALHACGNLHRHLLENGVAAGVARFDVAPCCYHRGVGEHYQPLSGNLRTTLTRDDVRLAVTETVTASARLTRQRDKEMAWRLGFDAYRRAVTVDCYQNFKPVPAVWFRASFSEFLTFMATREGLPCASPGVALEFEAAGWIRQCQVMRLSVVRHAFRRALEVWLVLDLARYLENQGYSVALGQFCARHLTPRNVLLSACRQ